MVEVLVEWYVGLFMLFMIVFCLFTILTNEELKALYIGILILVICFIIYYKECLYDNIKHYFNKRKQH